MTNARANEQGARPEPVIGMSDEVADLLGGVTSDLDQLVEGGQLDNCDVTIQGFDYDKGGEPMKDRDGTPILRNGEQVMTSPQIVMWLKVHDIDGIEDTRQFFAAPKLVTGPDGRSRFNPVNTNSKLGIFLATLAGFGIADNEESGDNYRFNGWRDLVGLHYRRQLQSFPGFRQGQTTDVHVPIAVYEFDNALREKAGLPAVTIEARGMENLQSLNTDEEPAEEEVTA